VRIDLAGADGQRVCMVRFPSLLALVFVLALTSCTATSRHSRPLRALLITGGCCHNYSLQTSQLTNAVAQLAAVEWVVVREGGSGTKAEISFYDDPGWARGYDVVVHNECFADTTNGTYIRKITSAHQAGVPAVVIHCAMHTYRAAEIQDWRELAGVTSKRHDHQGRYAVKLLQPEHPILKGMAPNWVVQSDELYTIEKTEPKTTVLATSVSDEDGKAHPVIWTGQYGKARVFGTTYGHSDVTWRDPGFLNYVSRGVLWAAGRPAN
jgi:type 1 glutamine amidotransferase